MEAFTETYLFITRGVINAPLPPPITFPEKVAKSFITLFNGEKKGKKIYNN